jgi:hyperosmotically inducible protein
MFNPSSRKSIAALALASALAAMSGCAVTRGEQSPSAYVEDSVITTQVKAKFAAANAVDATSIRVETINGTVLLNGTAKNANEKSQAEMLARSVAGVKSVNNRIDVVG